MEARARWRAVLVGGVVAVLVSGCGGGSSGSAEPGAGGTASTAPAPSTTPASPGSTGSLPTTTTTAPPPPIVATACAQATTSAVTGTLPDDLAEISGIAASRSVPGSYWVIEDSGTEPVVVRVTPDGTVVEVVRVEGATNVDWEDLAVGPGPDGTPHVWIADTGDNAGERDTVVLYRFPEPDAGVVSVPAEALTLTIEGGPVDAEALVVGEQGVFVIAKALATAPAVLQLDEAAGVLRAAGTARAAGAFVTGADLSADGRALVVRSYGRLVVVPVDGGDVLGALGGDGCLVPPPPELQGEAAAFTLAGDAVVTVGEHAIDGQPVDVHRTG